jgi:hypothetical protein
MITNSAELKAAARKLRILEDALAALQKQLETANPGLLEVSSQAYRKRIELLQNDMARYLGENPSDVSTLLRTEELTLNTALSQSQQPVEFPV